MKKYWVVNDFVSEIRQLKEHPNIYNIASVTTNELKYYKESLETDLNFHCQIL